MPEFHRTNQQETYFRRKLQNFTKEYQSFHRKLKHGRAHRKMPPDRKNQMKLKRSYWEKEEEEKTKKICFFPITFEIFSEPNLYQ